MIPLSPQARRLLELTRGADDPGGPERARVGQLLASRLARGGALAATSGGAKAAAHGLFAGGLKPALVALAVVGGLGGVGFVARQRGSVVPPSLADARAQKIAPTRASVGTGPTQAATSGAAPPTIAPRETLELPAAKPPNLHRASSPEPALPAVSHAAKSADATNNGRSGRAITNDSSVTSDTDATPGVDPLRAEADGLREAQRALRNGQAQTALQLLAVQDARFAGGLLVEERAAARVLSLCQAGLNERARLEAVRFAQRWPRSALLSRVRAGCLGE